MATHSSVLAWRIPGTGEPGGLLSMRSHKSQARLKRLSSKELITLWTIFSRIVKTHDWKKRVSFVTPLGEDS